MGGSEDKPIICVDWLAGLVAGRDAWLPQGTTLYYQDVFIDCVELAELLKS